MGSARGYRVSKKLFVGFGTLPGQGLNQTRIQCV